ncbi:MAG: Imm5 family immunity protein [Chloroflexaceae bacterium]|jgi:hypothetical protein|nr:Imm5 family immunity protein [Chloroflexaceae bacterium]
MVLPILVQQLIDDVLVKLPSSALDIPAPQQRRQIYQAIGGWEDIKSCRIRARIAILAAEHALPIYQESYPEDDLPKKLIEGARTFLQNPVISKEIEELHEWAYNASGHSWGYDEDELPLSVDYAGQAAAAALSGTTHGLYFLQDLDSGYGEQRGTATHIIQVEEWTNIRLLDFINACDSAILAGAAVSFDIETDEFNPKIWKKYWTWWLTKCIPAAFLAEERV